VNSKPPAQTQSWAVGLPVMLHRNINQSDAGLCNGTRMAVTRLGENVIEAQILTGNCKGAYPSAHHMSSFEPKRAIRADKKAVPFLCLLCNDDQAIFEKGRLASVCRARFSPMGSSTWQSPESQAGMG
jgi:hypothetical protein